MDFIVGLPNTSQKHDSIWVIIDRLTKIAHFLPVQSSLGTKLIRSYAYHPQTDGQTERVNQILEDMLRACTIHYGTNWDKCLALAEFSFNNSYQSSLQMASF
jgi:hypothetical protein